MEQTTLISSAEEQLKNFGTFLETYDKRLCQLLIKKRITGKRNENIALQRNEKIVTANFSTNQESLPILKLLESDRLPNKIILTFAHLCNEAFELAAEANRLQLQFLYIDEDLCTIAESQSKRGVASNGKLQKNEQFLLKISNSVEFLCKIQFLLQRCIILANNMLHQCGVYCAAGGSFDFKEVFDYLANLLHKILIFDEILQNSNLSASWSTYKKSIEAIGRKYSTQDFTSPWEINGLLNCLQELDFLFSGTHFRNFLDSTFSLKDKIGPKGLGVLTQQFNEYIKYSLNKIEQIHSPDLNDFAESHLIVRLNAFCIVCHEFCGQIEAKILKNLLEQNTKHLGITLIANIPWKAAEFLLKHAETLVKPYEKNIQEYNRQRQDFLTMRLSTLQRDCKNYCTQTALWSLNVHKSLQFGVFDLKVEQFKQLSAFLLQGLEYAGQMGFLVKAIVNAHVSLQTSMAKSTLLAVCKLIEMMKTIQLVYHKFTESISKIIQFILQYLQFKILRALAVYKKDITKSEMHDRNVDALAGIKIAEICLNGPTTNSRILVLKLALSLTNTNNRILTYDRNKKITGIIERINILTNFQDHLIQICDTTFIYWHQSILSSYLKQIIDKRIDFNSFQFIVQAMDNCRNKLQNSTVSNTKLHEVLKKSNYDSIRNDIIYNLCAQIETFLRLEVHSNLQLDKLNPFEQNVNDNRDLINVLPIQLNGEHVILKDHVENYLSTMFYNLTTITLHDWKTYEEMRQLANARLSLNPVKDYLPNQTIEQGIDILEIMRNIHIFVSKYVYNMNTQIFIEQNSNNKHLDAIGIRHVANSLRTHGSGIINTTVNFTYQFLRQKFYIFSQFLYDEQIKSRLMKELRAVSERKQSNQYPLYTYERADAFNKDIRKLGLSGNNQTYMDLFRLAITHIGNAMGYIRLVRSGSIHANYSASLYLPKFDENLQFSNKTVEEQLQDITVQAAENFEINVQNVGKSFSDSTDYFKILIEAFQPFFRNPHNVHLKIFYLIIPPLTLNYIEHILTEKEKILKKDNHGQVFFDDGFAVGLAYILRLLDQIGDFNSLQWFATVRSRFDAECRKIKEMHLQTTTSGSSKSSSSAKSLKQKSENEKLKQTLALTERRINAYQSNFNLLYFNLCSAKVFFQE